MKKIVFPILLFIASIQLMAQSKVGTVDSEFILSKLPELTKVQEDLKAYNAKLEAELKTKADEYQAKVAEYQKNVATMTEPMKKTKQEEIIALENDIAKFRQNGTQLVQLEQNKLLQPLYQKIGKVLEEVAKSEGYSQVLTITNSGLAYIDPKFDLTKTVMTKLGLKVE
ncbi:OmpH family outer membrane protein [Aquimarina sp. RZ0]|uniref:OmpH family outer membrane protein n=1 Tax=Aquimarina sp. RZ0 TaxID=2607730 RepID=UPI0011F369C2|nr:OmpH family outer membrane protein [Aquimarina sp. RZ0]KAA1242744.1 OmpH family outer membrane protein [Aquimarina sp. RZ0]